MADEYLPYIYAAKLSTGIYRISDKGKNVTFNDIVRVINTDPAYIIKNINTSNLAPYVDLVNDNDAELALSYTYKGISGIGEQGGKSAVPIIYRYVDPSHIGRLDLDASSSSDPGLSGVLCPMVETVNGQFAQYQETNGWEDHYSRIRQEANTNNGVIEGITFDKKPELAYEYVKDDMVKETIAEHTTFIDGILDINGYGFNGIGSLEEYFAYDVEEYRLQLENSVFDERGYIINQGKMVSIPFGWFNTRDKGCGWIAAYNLFKLNGKTMLMKDVLAGLKRFTFIGNLLGQEKISLYFWLKKQGLNAHISVGTNAKIIKKMCASKSGILLYIHRTNAHYVAYEVLKDGRIQFYNAVYGKKNHITTASEFLSENSFIPLSSLIYVD